MKLTLSNWNELKSDSQLKTGNSFNVGTGIDLNRNIGFLSNCNAVQNITPTGLTEAIQKIAIDATNDNAYIFECPKVYKLTNANSVPSVMIYDANFDGAAHNFYSVANMGDSVDSMVYNEGGTDYLFFAYGESTNGYLGKGSLTLAWSGANISATYKTLSSKTGTFKMENWQNKIWICVGRYIDTFDTDIHLQAFDVGLNWSAVDLFSNPNFLGILARKNNWNNRIYIIDGSSATTAVKIIPINGLYISWIENVNGHIVFGAKSTNGDWGIYELTSLDANDSYKLLYNLRYDIGGTMTKLYLTGYYGLAHGKLLFTTNYGLLWSFDGQKMVGTFPWTTMSANTTFGVVTSTAGLGTSVDGNILTGLYGGTADNNYYVKYINTGTYGGNSTATFKDGYIDFGQKVRINYVKFYFKPLASGDLITPTLDADYGTSWTLTDPNGNTTIGFTIDGAITSKRFNIKRDCHSIRPAISWTTGSTAISKITIDYQYLEDI
jgi:hypothetical protein